MLAFLILSCYAQNEWGNDYGACRKIEINEKKAGLTQKEVADKLGITYQSYGQYERGLRKPKYETVEKFAKALNFDISELLTPAEESEMIIDGLLDEFESRKKDRQKRQNDAEARVGGDYSVYLMNLLVDHAQIISALTSMGVDIRFETSKMLLFHMELLNN